MKMLRNIPSDWELKTLGEIGTIVNGLTYSPKDVSEEGLLVLRSSNIQEGVLAFEDNVYVNSDAVKYNPIRTNDILICVRNGSRRLIGKNTLIPPEHEGVAFGAFMTVFRSEHNQYLQHVFSTDVFYWEVQRNLGATINSINGSDLKKFKVPIPPLPEQKKIAAILSKWDELIETQTQLIAAKEQQKKGLMQKLLTGELRFPGFEGEWEVVKMDDIFIIARGGSPRPIDDYITEDDDGLNWIKIGDTNPKTKFIYTTKQKIKKEGLSRTVQVVENDFILSNSMSFGKPYIMKTTGCIHDGWLLLRKKIDSSIDYMFYLLGSSVVQRQYLSLAAGSAVKNLNKQIVCEVKLNIPKVVEQKKIADLLSKIDVEIENLTSEKDSYVLQKKGLMQQLLTGKIRVKV